MKNQLSTDELFHFTKFDFLLGIIQSGFYPRYNMEHTFLSDLFERKVDFALIPMVCFCDIPLNMVEEHSEKYGKCAIGLTKKWGEKYGLNPVIYIHKNSIIADAIAGMANAFNGFKSSMILDGSDTRIFSMISQNAIGFRQLSYNVKQYEQKEDIGALVDGKPVWLKKGRFYDEREWRYFPPNSWDDNWLLDLATYHDKSKMESANQQIKRYVLNFNIEDIKYIIYETHVEREALVKAVCDRFNIDKDQTTSKISFMKLDQHHKSSL